MVYDVFISYSHADNISSDPKEYGWVDSFYIELKKYLTEKLDRNGNAKIWCDKYAMTGNGNLDDAIYNNLDRSTILVPILSPKFINSKYCPLELDYFFNQRELKYIIPIQKAKSSSLPDSIEENFIKHKFEILDKVKQAKREIDPTLGGDDKTQFKLKISYLADEIAEIINDIEENPPPTDNHAETITVTDNRPLIYLAEPSHDLWEQHRKIKSDLIERKYNLLPPEINFFQKPEDAEEYKEKVSKDIEKCNLAIHLIGEQTNHKPKNRNPDQKSYLQIQTEVAAKRDGDFKFKRLIWLPNDRNTDEFIHREIRSVTPRTVEIVENPSIENFKANIKDALDDLKRTDTSSPPPPPDEDTWVYVLYDKSDLKAASKLESLLANERNCNIFSSRDYIEPLLEGNTDIDCDEVHNKYLKECDAVLIFWRFAENFWLKLNIRQIQKSKAARDSDFRTRALFYDENLATEKRKKYIPPASLLMVDGYSDLDNFTKHLEVQN